MLVGLSGLTVATGLVDATSYLGLGHVFTANMTGNVVFLGFALGGAPGFSIVASLLALGGFLLGALGAGRLVRTSTDHHKALAAFGFEGIALIAGTVIAGVVHAPGAGAPRWVLTCILGTAMGVQNATVRRLAVADMTTTVLTLTLTGIASDSSLAGGSNPRLPRRATSVLLMLGGAIVGAALERRALWCPMALATLIVVGTTTTLASG